jgi:SAM-dependent methyltransferase
MSYTPDGTPVEVYRRMPERGEAATISGEVRPGGVILELGSGAGRVTHALVALGHPVTAVDESAEMLAEVRARAGGAKTVQARIEDLDLGRRFDGVVLGSNLVNTPDDVQRHAFLTTCRRHAANDGVVLVEYLDAAWAAAANEGGRGDLGGGISARMGRLRRDGTLLSVEMVYRAGDDRWVQAFTARILDDEQLATELAAADLAVRRRIDRSWIVAVPA